jgi:hypothetical protein
MQAHDKGSVVVPDTLQMRLHRSPSVELSVGRCVAMESGLIACIVVSAEFTLFVGANIRDCQPHGEAVLTC